MAAAIGPRPMADGGARPVADERAVFSATSALSRSPRVRGQPATGSRAAPNGGAAFVLQTGPHDERPPGPALPTQGQAPAARMPDNFSSRVRHRPRTDGGCHGGLSRAS